MLVRRAALVLRLATAGVMGGCWAPHADPGEETPTPPSTGGGTGAGGSTLGPSPGAPCHDLDNAGAAQVTDVRSTQLLQLQGGDLTDGRYLLTSYEWFDSQAVLHHRKIVLVVSDGGSVGKYLWQRDSDPDERVTVSISTTADRITMRGTCPSGSDLEWDRYGMSPTGLSLFSTRDSKAATFVRL
jgi:hypothetical protein